jgi:propionyl-CoA synthetase
MGYAEEYRASIEEPAAFWAEKATELDWYKPASHVLDTDERGIHHWFGDGELNTCHLALDFHVDNGRADQTALIYDSPVTGQQRKYSFRELRDEVATCAGMLRQHGVDKGDVVVIYLPMIPEALISMLACARLGAVHSVVFGGFAPLELAVRLDDATPKVVLTASCGIEVKRVIEYKPIVDAAIEIATHKPDTCIVLQRPEALASLQPGRDVDWQQAMAVAEPVDCVPVKGCDPLYILYTSGTTGKPKGVVRENGGHAVAMKYSMTAIYDMQPGEVFWAASDVGWVVGHSYIADSRLYHGSVRGQTNHDAGCRRFLAGYLRAPGQGIVYRADRISCHQKRRPGSRLRQKVRSVLSGNHFRRRRTARSADLRMARRPLRRAGNRSLVADGNRLVHRRKPARPRTDAGQVRFLDRASARL